MPAIQAHPDGRRTRERLRVLEAGASLLAERGFEGASLAAIARHAGVPLARACRYFATREHLALALYERLSLDFAAWIVDAPAGPLSLRFAAAMRARFSLLAPHRRALAALAACALDPDSRAAVLGDAAEVVRSRVSGVFAALTLGATDVVPGVGARRLARALYGAHLALVALWLQDRSEGSRVAHGALDLLCDLLTFAAPSLSLDEAPPLLARVDGIFGALLQTTAGAGDDEIARAVLTRIFRRRRLHAEVAGEPSEAAFAVHLERVRVFVDAGEPVHLVLPAFPAKAPNPEKVLGRRADMAEALALESLVSLLDEIAEAHAPGATLTICSDGHVFADAVGVSDADVTRYRRDIEAMIDELGAERVRVFGLEDAFGRTGFDEARRVLLERYAQPAAAIEARAASSTSHRAQLDGIHRFMFEDACALRPDVSRTRLRKEARPTAIEVVRRSDAWGALVAAAFPRAVRLSIHPQPDVSDKIGVHLLATDDAWLTPWHGCALLDGGRFKLVRRRDAGAATVVDDDGRPSHLEAAP